MADLGRFGGNGAGQGNTGVLERAYESHGGPIMSAELDYLGPFDLLFMDRLWLKAYNTRDNTVSLPLTASYWCYLTPLRADLTGFSRRGAFSFSIRNIARQWDGEVEFASNPNTIKVSVALEPAMQGLLMTALHLFAGYEVDQMQVSLEVGEKVLLEEFEWSL